MLDADIQIEALIDVRSRGSTVYSEMLAARGVKILARSAVVCAKGRKRVTAVEVMELSNDLESITGTKRVYKL